MFKNVDAPAEMETRRNAYFTISIMTEEYVISSYARLEAHKPKNERMRTCMLSMLSLDIAKSPSIVDGKCSWNSLVKNSIIGNATKCVTTAGKACMSRKKMWLWKLRRYLKWPWNFIRMTLVLPWSRRLTFCGDKAWSHHIWTNIWWTNIRYYTNHRNWV